MEIKLKIADHTIKYESVEHLFSDLVGITIEVDENETKKLFTPVKYVSYENGKLSVNKG